MAVGPIGNAIFVNQQMANVSSVQSNQNNRFDLQNVMAQAAANEKDEKVMEVRPTEENQEVDPDTEHEADSGKEGNAKKKKKNKEQDQEPQEQEIRYTIDIKV